MTLVWYLCNLVIDGPQLMLLLNMLFIWLSIALLYESFKKDFPKAVLFLFLMPFTPRIISNSQMIWKDVFMANIVLFICSIAFFCYYKKISQTNRTLIFFASFIILLIGISAKFQAKFIGPLILCLMFHGILKMKIKLSLCAGIVAALLLYFLSSAISFYMGVKDSRSEQLRHFFDLAGISVCADQDLMPKYIKSEQNYNFSALKENYGFIRFNQAAGTPQKPLFLPTKNDANLDALEANFFTSAFSYPSCYIKQRWLNFKHIMSLRSIIIEKYEHLGIADQTKHMYDFYSSFYVQYAYLYIASFKSLTRGFLFLFINLVTYVFASILIFRKNKSEKQSGKLHLIVISISVAYLAALFLTTMDADSRFNYLSRLITTIFLPLQVAYIYKSFLKIEINNKVLLVGTILILGLAFNKVRLYEIPVNVSHINL